MNNTTKQVRVHTETNGMGMTIAEMRNEVVRLQTARLAKPASFPPISWIEDYQHALQGAEAMNLPPETKFILA
jgi:hypothetical protein